MVMMMIMRMNQKYFNEFTLPLRRVLYWIVILTVSPPFLLTGTRPINGQLEKYKCEDAEAQPGPITKGAQPFKHLGEHGELVVSVIPLDIIPTETDVAVRGRAIRRSANRCKYFTINYIWETFNSPTRSLNFQTWCTTFSVQ